MPHRGGEDLRAVLGRHEQEQGECGGDRLARSKTGMGQAEVGHQSGAPERHRVDGGQVRGEGEDLPGRGDRLLDVAAAQAGERPQALTDP